VSRATSQRAPSSLIREPGVAQRIACAAFAWSVTVAPFVLGRSGSWLARFVAAFALAAGVLGPLLVPTRRRLGRHMGISAYLALTTVVWLLSPGAIDAGRLDPILAIIGAVAWSVFAFSWGEPWRLRGDAEIDELGSSLRARTELPPFAVPIAALGVLSSIALLVLAWRVRDPSRGLVAQAAGIGLGVALVSGAAEVAINRGRSRHGHAVVPRSGRRAMIVLVVAAVLGGVLLVLRGS